MWPWKMWIPPISQKSSYSKGNDGEIKSHLRYISTALENFNLVQRSWFIKKQCLLYVSNTWSASKKHLRALEGYHQWHLCKIFKSTPITHRLTSPIPNTRTLKVLSQFQWPTQIIHLPDTNGRSRHSDLTSMPARSYQVERMNDARIFSRPS